MPDYRWNAAVNAAGFDAAAEHIHPFYLEIQDRILAELPFGADEDLTLIDAGGGSGRLIERFLDRFPNAHAINVDQSEPFLNLAQTRLSRFGVRVAFIQSRLQDDWEAQLPEVPAAVVSMSAIHHLDPAEKQTLYRRCHEVLRPGGIFLNGDEVRPALDADYLAECQKWAVHKNRIIEAGLVSPAMADALRQWEERNVNQFGAPKKSGDDCHETVESQLEYLGEGGFAVADAPWRKGLWAILRGRK